MKSTKISALVAALLLMGTGLAFAATDTAAHDVTMTVNEIALIDLNNTGAITLTTNAPTNGGEDPLGDSDASKLLQYTSLVAGGTTRNITVNWGGTDAAPAGTSLKVEATSVPGGCGTGGGQLTISDTGQNLITGVASCATGTGASGAEITYTFSIDTISLLDVGESQTVTITFTMLDAS
jgi:hypothetical protein